jgi:hypothetical protein
MPVAFAWFNHSGRRYFGRESEHADVSGANDAREHEPAAIHDSEPERKTNDGASEDAAR